MRENAYLAGIWRYLSEDSEGKSMLQRNARAFQFFYVARRTGNCAGMGAIARLHAQSFLRLRCKEKIILRPLGAEPDFGSIFYDPPRSMLTD